MKVSTYDILYKLLCVGLGIKETYTLPGDIDWTEVYNLSERQDVSAIAIDGLQNPDEGLVHKAKFGRRVSEIPMV